MVLMAPGSHKYTLATIRTFCWNSPSSLVGWSNLGGLDKEEADKVWKGWPWLVMAMWVRTGAGGSPALNSQANAMYLRGSNQTLRKSGSGDDGMPKVSLID